MWASLLGGLMGSGAGAAGAGAAGAGAGSQFGTLLGSQPGSMSEWNNFNNAGFDQISNQGITGSMSGNSDGLTMGNLMGMAGGGGGGGSYGKMAYQHGITGGLGMENYAQIAPLMSMVSKNANAPDPFMEPKGNQYIKNLMSL